MAKLGLAILVLAVLAFVITMDIAMASSHHKIKHRHHAARIRNHGFSRGPLRKAMAFMEKGEQGGSFAMDNTNPSGLPIVRSSVDAIRTVGTQQRRKSNGKVEHLVESASNKEGTLKTKGLPNTGISKANTQKEASGLASTPSMDSIVSSSSMNLDKSPLLKNLDHQSYSQEEGHMPGHEK